MLNCVASLAQNRHHAAQSCTNNSAYVEHKITQKFGQIVIEAGIRIAQRVSFIVNIWLMRRLKNEFMWNEWVSNSWTDTPWCLLGYAHFEQLFIRLPPPIEQNGCFAVQSDFPDLFDMWRLIMSRSFCRFCRQLPWKPIMLLTLYGRMSYGLMVTSLKHVQWLIGELLFSQSAPWVE